VTKRILILVAGLCAAASAAGQEIGFLTDYSLLEARERDIANRIYVVPDLRERLKDYNAFLVDQPEIFIAPDSKYTGAKGDQLKLLADTVRLATNERLEAGGYLIVEEPGPGVMYVRFAVAHVYLKKKKRGLLSYTPMGFVVHSTMQAAVRDLWKKIDIVELSLEMEFSDSVTGEILAAGTSPHGMRKSKDQKQDLVTWEELDAVIRTVGERMRCQLDNARTPRSEWHVCTDIIITAEKAESR
jgi:hypothetical protein